MSCPTCDHTTQGIGNRWFWCPRCGTILNDGDEDHRARTTSVPYSTTQIRNWLHNPRYVSHKQLREALIGILHPDERAALETDDVAREQ